MLLRKSGQNLLWALLTVLIVTVKSAEAKCSGTVKFIGMDKFGGFIDLAKLVTIEPVNHQMNMILYLGGDLSVKCGEYSSVAYVPGFVPSHNKVTIASGKKSFVVVELSLGLLGGQPEPLDKKISVSKFGRCNLLWVKVIPLASKIPAVSIDLENQDEIQLGNLEPGRYFLHGAFEPGCSSGASMIAVLSVSEKDVTIVHHYKLLSP